MRKPLCRAGYIDTNGARRDNKAINRHTGQVQLEIETAWQVVRKRLSEVRAKEESYVSDSERNILRSGGEAWCLNHRNLGLGWVPCCRMQRGRRYQSVSQSALSAYYVLDLR